jgi:predicted nucleotidyltransferase
MQDELPEPCRPEELSLRPSTAPAANIEGVRATARAYRAANPRVFGSVLHGTDADGSDLDLLVDALPGATLFDMGGLQVALQDLLKVSVDVLTQGDLPPKYRDRVLLAARPV